VKWGLDPNKLDVYDIRDMILVDMDKTKLVANYYGFTGLPKPSIAPKDSLDEIMGLINGLN